MASPAWAAGPSLGISSSSRPRLGNIALSSTAPPRQRTAEQRQAAWDGVPLACCVTFLAAAVKPSRRPGRSRAASVLRRASITGPGWSDELARIFDPREEGPDWHYEYGYRGRRTLRLLLDAEDLAHSYAYARWQQTGKWTGPLSEGIEKALEYGAWGGGEPEERAHPDPDNLESGTTFTPPEMLTFVAMPADLIEASKPENLCDGYPEDVRETIGNVITGEDGVFVNENLRSLQDDDRLLTWHRPNRLPGGGGRGGFARPNALMYQKYYQPGKIVAFQGMKARPVVLSQCMGAGTALKVGDKVEALKPGAFIKTAWTPSKWEKAEVLAVNYDGTYDIQFEDNAGPYRERRTKGLRGLPTLSLRKNEIWRGYAADHMPAYFRMLQEKNYMSAVPASNMRLPGMLERICDTYDAEASQDWYLCTSRKFIMSASGIHDESGRLDDFAAKFIFDYRWVPTEDGGLRFEPVPNSVQAQSLRACHNDVAQEFANAAKADEEPRRRLKKYQEELRQFEIEMGDLEGREDTPRRAAGPLVDPYAEGPQPIRVPS
eukprot:TRINITY_DN92615_c0_g1_i1.p1 TRINITY_DN92615_c0_g1~~TRINITY_DN92615_c0_g1_i1.p1  ORF type:complete len:567 (-),score=107.31 TRINITY_DN92615_c0_g1_i1:55-1695(-)